MDSNVSFNEEEYTKIVREKLDWLLNYSFLSTNVYNMSTTQIESYLQERTREFDSSDDEVEALEGVSKIKNFCVLMRNSGHENREYYNIHFNVAVLKTENRSVVINYRQFRCKMHPRKDVSVLGGNISNCMNYTCHSEFMNGVNDISEYFSCARENPVMLCYCFPSIDDYNKERECYRLLDISESIEEDIANIRNAITQSQHFFLSHLLKCTTLYAPYTKMYYNGKPTAMPWTIWEEPAEMFEEIFNNEYRSKFEAKLAEIENIMSANNLRAYDRI